MPHLPPGYDRTWGRRVVVLALASLIIASVAMLILLWGVERRRSQGSAEAFAFATTDGGTLPKLWQAPSFALVDQHHREVTLDSLRGEPFVADFIFTQCTSACPMLTSRMVMLQRGLAGQDVRFVSFSVDPVHDTPDALADYEARWNVRETRWSLLATNEESLADVAAGFKVATEKTHDERNPILHSSLFFLVDGDGGVRAVYPSNDEEAMARLAADVLRLSKAAPASDASVPPSRELYASLGCAGCHDNPNVAPPFVNLASAERMLSDGSKVAVDDAYLRRAILEPGAEVVQGYMPLMPSYRQALTDAQVDLLVAELDARSGGGVSALQASAAIVVDPVCHMKVRAAPGAPHVTFEGQDVFFCSDTCRDKFAKNPKRYPPEPLAGGGAKGNH